MTGALHRLVRTRSRESDRERTRRIYVALREKGTIGTMQAAVYDHVARHPGAVSSEIAAALHKHPNEVMPRLLELERDGHLHRGNVRRSRVTRVESVMWHAQSPAALQLVLDSWNHLRTKPGRIRRVPA